MRQKKPHPCIIVHLKCLLWNLLLWSVENCKVKLKLMTKWVLSFILFCVFTSGNLQEKQSSNSIANLLFNGTCTEEWILHKLPIWILSSLKLCIIRGAAALGGREVQLSTCKPSSQLIPDGPLNLFCRVVVFLRILM